MSFTGLLFQTVDIERMIESAVDEYGDPSPAVLEIVRTKGRLQRTESAELTAGRQTVVTDWTVFLPPETVALIDANDRVVIDGRRYEVVGPPETLHGARGQIHHLEARLRYVGP